MQYLCTATVHGYIFQQEEGCTGLVSSRLSGNSCFCISFFFLKKIERICMWNVVDVEKIMQTVPTELEAYEFKENYL